MQSATVWTRVRADSEPETVQLQGGWFHLYSIYRERFLCLFSFFSFFVFSPFFTSILCFLFPALTVRFFSLRFILPRRDPR